MSSANSIVNYINSQSTGANCLSGARLGDPITHFSLFSHGLDSNGGIIPLAFNYEGGHNTDAGKLLTLSIIHIGSIKLGSFSDNVVSYFYSCNTGTAGKQSFAQQWANVSGGVTYAFSGGSSYKKVSDNSLFAKIMRQINPLIFGGNTRLPVAGDNGYLRTFFPQISGPWY